MAAVPDAAAAGAPAWVVTLNSLVSSLQRVLDTLFDEYVKRTAPNSAPKQRPAFEAGGLLQDAPLVRLAEPPEVRVTLTLEPPAPATTTVIESDGGVRVAEIPPQAGPATVTLPAGFYRAILRTGDLPTDPVTTRFRLLLPPRAEWKVTVPPATSP